MYGIDIVNLRSSSLKRRRKQLAPVKQFPRHVHLDHMGIVIMRVDGQHHIARKRTPLFLLVFIAVSLIQADKKVFNPFISLDKLADQIRKFPVLGNTLHAEYHKRILFAQMNQTAVVFQ